MKYKVITGIVLFVIIVIPFFQNIEKTQIQLYFWEVSTRPVLIMALMFLLGAVVGWIANRYYKYLRAKKKGLSV
jgi:uncharacterized integral membrane protein